MVNVHNLTFWWLLTVHKRCCVIIAFWKKYFYFGSLFSLVSQIKSYVRRGPSWNPISAEAQKLSVYITFVSNDHTTPSWAHGILQGLQTQETGISNIHILIVTLICSHQLTKGLELYWKQVAVLNRFIKSLIESHTLLLFQQGEQE